MIQTLKTQQLLYKKYPKLKIIRYAGGKDRILKYIFPYLPPRDSIKGRFVEPFVGSAAVFFALNPKSAILSDISNDLMNLYRGIKKDPLKVWKLFESFPSTKSGYYAVRSIEIKEKDLVFKDGQTIKAGDTAFQFYVTPGHTPGATSIEFQVRDRGKTYRALTPGGLGMQFGPAETPTFLKSMERLKQLGPWDVMLSNHPWLMPRTLDDLAKGLASRGRGAHPAVLGPAKINEWFDAVIKVTKEKLAAGE